MNRTIDTKNKGVAFWRIIKICDSYYLSYLIVIGEAITGNIDDIYQDTHRIIRVLDYQVNWEGLDKMMEIVDSICTKAHANHSLYCEDNTAIQKHFLIFDTS